ncbi:MAG TPA: hypothetical protein VKD19_05110, partial [Pseudolabrys sp.]|nr:hypothetical protein [Pseudolabrys sp.]
MAFDICSQSRRSAALPPEETPIQPSLTVLAHTAVRRNPILFSYQMAVTTQSFRTVFSRFALAIG